jgi:hypothetical protein
MFVPVITKEVVRNLWVGSQSTESPAMTSLLTVAGLRKTEYEKCVRKQGNRRIPSDVVSAGYMQCCLCWSGAIRNLGHRKPPPASDRPPVFRFIHKRPACNTPTAKDW